MTTARGRTGSICLATLLFLAILASPAWAITPCDSHGGTLDDLETHRQLRDFVHCAVAHVQNVGWDQASIDFQTQEAWMDGSVYLFAGGLDYTVHFIAGSEIPAGTDMSELKDVNGFPISLEMGRIVNNYGAGYLYYFFQNRNSGAIEPKTVYVTTITVDGESILLGSGIHPQDVVGACPPATVRASLIYTERDLEHFVRCAGHHLRMTGLRGLFDLVSDARWHEGAMYIAMLDLETGVHVAGGPDAGALIGIDQSDLEDDTGYRITEDAQRILQYHDEGYIYYKFRNPATDQFEPKTSFIQRFRWGGRDYILLSGVYGQTPACALNAAHKVDTRTELELYVACARDLIKARGLGAFDLFNFHPHWFSGSRYIFVLNEQCATIVYPIDYEASSVQAGNCDMEGPDGQKVLQALWDMGSEAEEGGWVNYVWHNPGTDTLETKESFVLPITVDGETLVVGAGLYQSDFTE